jgi:predicted GIY-YIG superfamily endonuclease
MSIGIYKIENLLNGKIYIGQSKHIETRWSEHCRNSN